MNWVLAGQTNMLGRRFATGLTSRPIAAAAPVFTPASLFAAGEQGVWYDPSDLTTMFEDSAGTTPVHTPGNGVADSPVGLLLDKSKSGVGTNGAARYNLLTYTEQFDNAVWAKWQSTVSANATTAPDGTSTADKFIPDASNYEHYVAQGVSKSAGAVSYTSTIYVKSAGYDFAPILIADWNGAAASNGWYFCVNLTDGTYTTPTTFGTGWSVGTVSITRNSTTGWCKIVTTFTTSSSSTQVGIGVYAHPSSKASIPFTFTGDGTSGVYVWGGDLRLTSQAALTPTYQPITSSWLATIAGNHATQSTSTARPTLSAKYNLATYTEQFDNVAWVKYNGSSVAANSTTAPDGTATADTLTLPAGVSSIYQGAISTTGGVTYTASVSFKKNTHRYGYLNFAISLNERYAVLIDLDTGLYVDSKTKGTISNSSYSIVSQGNGWYRLSVTGSVSSSNSYIIIQCTDTIPITVNADLDITNRATSGSVYIWGADLRATNDGVGLPDYQRVVDASTYDSTGFPYYLKSDGVDDTLSNAAVDFSTTNKLSLFVGFRKLGSGLNLIVDIGGGASTQSEALYDSSGTLNLYSAGSASVNISSSSKPSPFTEVVSALTDIAIPVITLRENGTQTATSANSLGTGNYKSSSVYVASRNGTTYWFSGRTYGVILRGASSTATEISNTESWLNGKTKAY